jgi:Luciferase-like monooxygenase
LFVIPCNLSRRTARRQPDPYILLAAADAVTQRAKLGTIVANASLQHPALLLPHFSQMARLFGGERVYAGLGAGWNREEFEALGLVWQAQVNECSAWRRPWSSDASSSTKASVIFKAPRIAGEVPPQSRVCSALYASHICRQQAAGLIDSNPGPRDSAVILIASPKDSPTTSSSISTPQTSPAASPHRDRWP